MSGEDQHRNRNARLAPSVQFSLGVWGGLGKVVWRVFRFGVNSFVILLGLGSPGGWVSGSRDLGIRKFSVTDKIQCKSPETRSNPQERPEPNLQSLFWILAAELGSRT